MIDDLISAAIAQDAYQKALPALADLPAPASAEFAYVSRTPHVFAQAWVRCLRDVAGELTVLADEPSAAEGARAAAAAFGQAFPGIAGTTGAMRVTSAGKDLAYFVAGTGVYPVRIDAAAVRQLEALVQTLIDALPKEAPFKAPA